MPGFDASRPADAPCPRLDGLPGERLADGRRVAVADSFRARLRGLARLDALPRRAGLLIPKCSSVHTFTMRFALDLVWLGPGGDVVRVDRDVPRRRMRSCRRARSVVEVNAGEADAFLDAGLRAGWPPRAPGSAPD